MINLELTLEFIPIIIAFGASIISFLIFERSTDWMCILSAITLWKNSIWTISQQQLIELTGMLRFTRSRRRPRPGRKPPDRAFRREKEFLMFLKLKCALLISIALFSIEKHSTDIASHGNWLIVESNSASALSAQTASLNPSVIANTLSQY